MLKTKESEQSHVSKVCRFRPEDFDEFDRRIKRPAKALDKARGAAKPGPSLLKPEAAAAATTAGWEAQLAKLKAYKRRHGDCGVPTKRAEDPRLGSWVSEQRRGKKRLDRGEPSRRITAERAAKLTALGFAWAVNARPAKAAGKAPGAPTARQPQ